MGTFNDLLIEIGIDTRPAKKAINDFEKSFSSIGKKLVKVNNNSAKESAKVFETMFKEKEKYALEANKAAVKAEDIVRKKAKESAKVFEQMYNEKERQAEALRQKEAKSFVDRKRRQAALKKQRLKDEEDLLQQARKNLNERLKAYKNVKKKERQEQQKLSDFEDAVNKEKLRDIARQNKLIEKQKKLLEQRNRRAEAFRISLKGSSGFQGMSGKDQDKTLARFDAEKAKFLKTGDTNGFKVLTQDVKNFKRELKGLRHVQNGLTDSTRNMIRSYASLFALMEGTSAIERIGMEFQGMEVAMLASSGSAAKAQKDLAFVNNLADTTGGNLKELTDSYVKMQFALKGKIDDKQFKTFYTNMNRVFTALKLTPEQMKLSSKALQQMANKNQVMSEELKGQLAESLPGAVQIFAKAMNVTEKELFKLMEKGQVNFLDILPKISKEFYDVSEAGDAYNKSLEALRVQKGLFTNEATRSANKIFKSGFEDGLSELYKTLTGELKSTGKAQEDLGNIYANFFKFLAKAVKVITPILEAAINVTSKLTDAIMLSVKGWEMMPAPIKAAGLAFLYLNNSMAKVMLKGVAILALFQEVASLFDDNLVGVLEAKMGSQFNLATGKQTGLREENGKYFSTGETKDLFATKEGVGVGVIAGLASLGSLVYVIKKLRESILVLTGVMKTKDGVGNISKNKSKSAKTSSKTSTGFVAGATAGVTSKATLRALGGVGALVAPANEKHGVGVSTIDPLDVRRYPSGQSFDINSLMSNQTLHSLNNRSPMIYKSSGQPVFNNTISVSIDGTGMNESQLRDTFNDRVLEALERDISTAIRGGR